MADEIDPEVMLLAMIVDDLRGELPRGRRWIIERQGIDPKEQGFRFLQFFSDRKRRESVRKIDEAIQVGVANNFISEKKRGGETLYAATQEGQEWSESIYAAAGLLSLEGDDGLFQLTEIVEVLDREKRGLSVNELLDRLRWFDPDDRQEASPGEEAMHRAIDRVWPKLVAKGLEQGVSLGWLEEREGRWFVTEKGKENAG